MNVYASFICSTYLVFNGEGDAVCLPLDGDLEAVKLYRFKNVATDDDLIGVRGELRQQVSNLSCRFLLESR